LKSPKQSSSFLTAKIEIIKKNLYSKRFEFGGLGFREFRARILLCLDSL
jgi:hypothetical protein